MDIVSGPFWYEGPDFKTRHEYRPATATFQRQKADGSTETIAGFEGALGTNNAYSDDFLTFVYDFNGDGWPGRFWSLIFLARPHIGLKIRRARAALGLRT